MQTVEVSIPDLIWSAFKQQIRTHEAKQSDLVLAVIRNYSKQLRTIRVGNNGNRHHASFLYDELEYRDIEKVAKQLLTSEDEVVKRAIGLVASDIEVVGRGDYATVYSKRNLKLRRRTKGNVLSTLESTIPLTKNEPVTLELNLPLVEWKKFSATAKEEHVSEEILLDIAHHQFEKARMKSYRGKSAGETGWSTVRLEVLQGELESFQETAKRLNVELNTYLVAVVSQWNATQNRPSVRKSFEFMRDLMKASKVPMGTRKNAHAGGSKKQKEPVYLDIKVPKRHWQDFLKAALSVGLRPDNVLMTAHQQFEREGGKVFKPRFWRKDKLDEVRIPLTKEEYFTLEKAAGDNRVDIDNYIASIIARWLGTRNSELITPNDWDKSFENVNELGRKRERAKQRRKENRINEDRLLLEVELSEFADVDESAKAIAKFINGLSRLNIAYGGNDLEIEDVLPMEPAGELVPNDHH